MSTEAPAEAALPPEEFAAALRAVGEERYHHRHPFNVRMHPGQLSRRAIQLWVANRYYFYFPDRPKPCIGGWGARTSSWHRTAWCSPARRARRIDRLEFWNVAVVSARAARGETISGEDFRYRGHRETIELGS